MWIYLQNSFISIVAGETPDMLQVRGRRQGDVEFICPQAVVRKTEGRDYLYRAFLKKEEVSDAIAKAVLAVNYPNFKDGVKNHELHSVYLDVWMKTRQLQNERNTERLRR